MNRLVDGLRALLTAASEVSGDLSATARFILDNVNWTGPLSTPEPMSHPIVDTYLAVACAHSGPQGSNSHTVAHALLAVADQLAWPTSARDRPDDPDVAVFSRNYIANRVIGEGALLPSNKVSAGFSLQARDTYYPPHAHYAEESYWIIGGAGDWRVGSKPWFAVQPGDSVYHASEARHAMQTNEQPLLTVWAWTSQLDSEVLFVRG